MLRSADKRLFTSGQLSDIVGGEFQPVPSRRERSLPVTSTLAAWYDASDRATITDAGAGAVSAWADKSGNGYTATEATNRPVTGTRTINGLNVLDFDGTNDKLSSSLPADDLSSTVLSVISVDSLADYRTILGSNNTQGFCIRANQTTGAIAVEAQGIAAIHTSVAVATSTAYIVWCQLTSDACRIQRSLDFRNGSQTTHGTTFTAGRTAVIGASATTFFFDGMIGEIIVYSSTLGAGDLGKVIAYLSDKWAITN